MQVQAKTKDSPAIPAHKDAKTGKDVPAVPAKKGSSATVNYDIPADLPGMTKAFGDAVVYAAAKGAIIIGLQAFIRRHIDKGTAPADIQKEVTAWKPDVRSVVKQTAFEKANSAIKGLSAEERAKLLKDLQGMK